MGCLSGFLFRLVDVLVVVDIVLVLVWVLTITV